MPYSEKRRRIFHLRFFHSRYEKKWHINLVFFKVKSLNFLKHEKFKKLHEPE